MIKMENEKMIKMKNEKNKNKLYRYLKCQNVIRKLP